MSADIPYSIASNAKEFLAGVAAEQASYYNDKAKAVKDINKFVSDIDSDLRAVYDKYIPNIHVIDIVSFTNILANKIAASGTNVLDANTDTSIAIKFADATSTEYKGLLKAVKTAVKDYHTRLLAKQAVKNPISELNKLSLRLFNRTRKINNAVSARVLGAEFSSNINKVFGNVAVLAAIDPGLGSSDTKYVFFSSSFSSIGTPIRENIYVPVEAYIRDTLGTDTVSGAFLGKLVNTGHVSIVSEVGSFVNSPAFAQAIYGVGSGRSSRFKSEQVSEAAQVFKLESKLIENKIEVSKEFLSGRGGYGVLLSLGITFTNVEDAEVNADRGRTFEKATLKSFGITKTASITASQKKNIINTILRIVYRNNPLLGTSSRNIVQFISDAVKAELAGKQTKPERTSSTITNKIAVKVAKLVQGKANTFSKPSSSVKSSIPLRNVKGQFYSLVSLQSLINNNLAEQIQKNMGTGTSKNVLNYRTGRFAESARVERLTQSRDGQISAFYSYMRNPYGTFSEGGAQSSPRTRDPKLLISKSIREIAATQVKNRMRAVLI